MDAWVTAMMMALFLVLTISNRERCPETSIAATTGNDVPSLQMKDQSAGRERILTSFTVGTMSQDMGERCLESTHPHLHFWLTSRSAPVPGPGRFCVFRDGGFLRAQKVFGLCSLYGPPVWCMDA